MEEPDPVIEPEEKVERSSATETGKKQLFFRSRGKEEEKEKEEEEEEEEDQEL